MYHYSYEHVDQYDSIGLSTTNEEVQLTSFNDHYYHIYMLHFVLNLHYQTDHLLLSNLQNSLKNSSFQANIKGFGTSAVTVLEHFILKETIHIKNVAQILFDKVYLFI